MSDSVFDTAKDAPKPKSASKKKGALEEYPLPVQRHAAIKYVIKSLQGLEKVEAGLIEKAALPVFMESYRELFESGHPRHPGNFKGVEGSASTTIAFKKFSTSTTLTPEVVEMLEEAGISVGEEEDQEERFVFNNEVLSRPGVAKAVSEAIKSIPGAEGLVQKQTSETRYFVSDETIEDLFQKDPDTVQEIFPFVCSISLTSSMKDPKEVTKILTEAIEGKAKEKK